MAASGLEALKQTHDVAVTWRAYELRPPGAAPIPPQYLARIREGWPRVQQTALERFGLAMREPALGTGESGRTRLAHIGAQYAIAQGVGEAYHHAVFAAYWQQGLDIGDPAVLAQVAGNLGLDETAFRAALQNPAYLAQVEQDEYWAWQQQLDGVPAFIFANRYLVSGAQPVTVLRQVADRCLQEGLTTPPEATA